MGIAPGWYDDGSGQQRWWDGTQWTQHVHSGGSSPESGHITEHASEHTTEHTSEHTTGQPVGQQIQPQEIPVFQFGGTLGGKYTDVAVFKDRIVWSGKQTSVSAKKIAAGVFTAGLSLAVTGLGKGTYGPNSDAWSGQIRLDSVTGINCTQQQNRFFVTINSVGQFLTLEVKRKDANNIVQALNTLVEEARAASARVAPQSITVNVEGVTGESSSAAQVRALADPNTAQALQNLQNLLYMRVITDEEYLAAKNRIFGGNA